MSQRTREYRTTSGQDYATTLAFIQLPSNLIRLNPLVISYDAAVNNPSLYHITDSLSFCGIRFTTTTYSALFESTDRGVKVDVQAALGVRTQSEWTVEEIEGKVIVIEKSYLVASWWLIEFVERESMASHERLMIRLCEELDR